MKKIGIATVHKGYNFGSALQAYATKNILSELGYEGVNIALKGSLIKGKDVRIRKLAVIALRFLRYPIHFRKKILGYKRNMSNTYSENTKKLFDDFYQNLLNPYYLGYRKLKKIAKSKEFIAFLCGSDQIWNSDALYIDPLYYLRFAPKNKRIAFAPSLGRDYVADYNKKTIKKYIEDIPNLSIREESGVSIIKGLTNRDAISLIDPTLVLDCRRWNEYLKLRENNGKEKKYLLAYFLNEPSEYAKEYIKMIAFQKKLNVIALPYERQSDGWFDVAPDAGPIEFIKLLKDAFCICTDSFHGTAFAVNYKVPFYTFDRQYGLAGKQTSRIISFLNLVSLQEHFNPSKDLVNKSIDFKNSELILDFERKKSVMYIKNALESILEEKNE